MSTRVLIVFLLCWSGLSATYTEFYCQTSGSNLNAGSTTANTASLTYASGSWVQGTGVFTVASGNPESDGVAVGDWASVYPDAATVGVFVGRVTARDTTTITVSLSAKSGTAPVDGTSNTTLKIGGAWKGPNGSEAFPIGFMQATATNDVSIFPRVNFKNDATFAVTAAMTHSLDGPVRWAGYTTTPGDYGKANIDGGTSTSGYVLLAVSGKNHQFSDLIFSNNGNSGTSDGVTSSGSRNLFLRCVFHDFRRVGIYMTTLGALVECEAYNCNTSNNNTTLGAISITASGVSAIRCIARDNTQTQANGFCADGGIFMLHCISYNNGENGISSTGTEKNQLYGCDVYDNGGSGFQNTTVGSLIEFQNCNFLKNGAYGISLSGSPTHTGHIMNCGFGSGTMTNSSGNLGPNTQYIDQIGSVLYAADTTPWTDPDNGDFRISLAAAKGAGRGSFTQVSVNSPTNTVAYPDIGAAQHQDSAAPSGAQGSTIFIY